MKKITFGSVAPHLLAIAVFFLVTVFFFSPVFFQNKTLDQHDINEYIGTSKALRDHREATGEEPLWASQVFSGMPAYLISVDWNDGPVTWVKKIGGLFLPHPVLNIFWAFLSYYILLLTFRVRPYLAIAGALAFGLSSFMMIGLGAGHNGRIGAIAFMPLVLAGIHWLFSGNRMAGAGLTALALALQLRENHLQMTYYLVLMVAAYGLVRLVEAVRSGAVKNFLLDGTALALSVVLAAGTFFGQFWAISEYSPVSIRGKSELATKGEAAAESGLTRSYAFQYSNGIAEPLTLMVPRIFGGSTMEAFVSDENSETYKALVGSGDQETANQLAPYTIKYWGGQPNTAPYYAGAVVVFLFAIGLLFADRRWIWWLVPVSLLGIMMSWGDNFSAFNYFLFDHLPGYNKFRSVTFALIIILIAMPLLGLLGLEEVLKDGLGAGARKKLYTAFGFTGGLCLILWITGGFGSFVRPGEEALPGWLLSAMKSDREALLRADAMRSFLFMFIIFLAILFDVNRRVSPAVFSAVLILCVVTDLFSFDKQYFGKEKFRRASDEAVTMTDADKAIKTDTTYYRVYNLQDPLNEATTSYFHHSLGGYHGAKIRRYQDLFDSCIVAETNRLIADAQGGGFNFRFYGAINMLNAKYLKYGPGADNVLLNEAACGPAWLVYKVRAVGSPTEALLALRTLDTRNEAVIDASEFKQSDWEGTADSLSSINVISHGPRRLAYSAELVSKQLAVFSEIYYPTGWTAVVDGKAADILRVNYVLRGLWLEPGKHRIEFTFDPASYRIGDRVTQVFNWMVLLAFAGSMFLVWKGKD